jgi:hypothetical protein
VGDAVCRVGDLEATEKAVVREEAGRQRPVASRQPGQVVAGAAVVGRRGVDHHRSLARRLGRELLAGGETARWRPGLVAVLEQAGLRSERRQLPGRRQLGALDGHRLVADVVEGDREVDGAVVGRQRHGRRQRHVVRGPVHDGVPRRGVDRLGGAGRQGCSVDDHREVPGQQRPLVVRDRQVHPLGVERDVGDAGRCLEHTSREPWAGVSSCGTSGWAGPVAENSGRVAVVQLCGEPPARPGAVSRGVGDGFTEDGFHGVRR